MTSKRARSKSLPSSRKPRLKRGSTTRAPHPRRVALAEVKDDFSRYLRLAASEEIVITRHGRAAGVLIGFESEDDWFEYRLEHHPEFLKQIEAARTAIAAGRGTRLEDLPE
jgi:prevent-host-death family protein